MDLDALDQLLEMVPGPVEPRKAPHVGRVEHSHLHVHGHHDRRGPLTAASGHPCPWPQAAHDVLQRVRGLQDVVDGAKEGGVGAGRDRRVLGPRLHHRDVAPALRRDVLARHRDHLGRFLDADDLALRADLVPQQAAAQPGPASNIEDQLAGADRQRLHDRLAVGLEHGGVPFVGTGVLAIGRHPGGGLAGRRMRGRCGSTGPAHNLRAAVGGTAPPALPSPGRR